MRTGIGTFTYGWAFAVEDAPDERWLVDTATAMGVSLVQVGDNLPLHTFSPGRLSRFRALLAGRGVGVEVGARGLWEERLARYISICGELGASILRFVTDEDGYRPDVRQVTELIRRHIGVLESSGVTLAIENHDRMGAKELAEIIEGVGSPYVGICLDTANSLGAGENIDTVLDHLAVHTVNLHIKDYGIRRLAHKQGFIIDGRMAGEGMLDIPSIARRVGDHGRCESCILEQWAPLEEDMARTIGQEHAWAERGIAYLRGIGL